MFLLAALMVLACGLTGCGSSAQGTIMTPAEKACGNQIASSKGYKVTSWSPITVQPVVAHPTATATFVVSTIKLLCIVTTGTGLQPATTATSSQP